MGFGAGASSSVARCSASWCATSMARCSCSFSAKACRAARRWGSGAATTRIGFQEIWRPSLDRNTLVGSISISSRASLPAGGSQYVILPCRLSVFDSKRSAHPSRMAPRPFVAHTTSATASGSAASRKTTRGFLRHDCASASCCASAPCCAARRNPRTTHLRPAAKSATFPVRPTPRAVPTSIAVSRDFSAYCLPAATSWAIRSSSSARRRCSSS